MNKLSSKIELLKFNTPLYKMNYSIDDINIFIKRDDLMDFGIGGNKVRKLEYILHEPLKSGVEKLITFGSIHSNHVRITASIANYFDLDCDIIILTDKNEKEINIEGNRFLLDFYNANVFYSKLDEAKEYIDNHLEKKNKGNYFFIPGGAHSIYGALGYVEAMHELIEQTNDNFDAIFLPTGTGTTQAGLIFGKKLLNLNLDIIGISVARKKERCKRIIKETLTEMNKEFNEKFQYDNKDIIVEDKYLDAYGEINNSIIDIIKSIERSDGILLDPIYNSKAFLGMKKILEKNKDKYKNILYLNTGGLPNIFTEDFIEGIKKYEYINY